MEKSLEELVIKLRNYKLDVGSGTMKKLQLSNYCKTEIISLNVINETDFIKKSYLNLF